MEGGSGGKVEVESVDMVVVVMSQSLEGEKGSVMSELME